MLSIFFWSFELSDRDCVALPKIQHHFESYVWKWPISHCTSHPYSQLYSIWLPQNYFASDHKRPLPPNTFPSYIPSIRITSFFECPTLVLSDYIAFYKFCITIFVHTIANENIVNQVPFSHPFRRTDITCWCMYFLRSLYDWDALSSFSWLTHSWQNIVFTL